MAAIEGQAMDLAEWIEHHAAFVPQRRAIVSDSATLDYARLAARVSRAVRALGAVGVRAGERVAFLGYNRPQTLELLFACARLGAVFAPLNWRLAPPEWATILADCRPRVLVVEDAFANAVRPLLAALPDTLPVRLGDGADPGWTSWDDWLERDANGVRVEPAGAGTFDSPILLSYTSGSTGEPKGVLLSQRALFFNAVNSAHLHALTGGDVVLTTLPLFHVGGLNILTVPALHAGATVILHPRFDPGATFDALEREGVTLTVLVPAQLEAMMADPRWDRVDLSRLRCITTGSTIIGEAFVRRVQARGVPVVQVYGATETCPIAAYLPIDDALRKPGSVGKAALHCDLRLVDDGGTPVPPGVTGEILVRGPSVMSGYLNKPAETAVAFDGEWYRSGDVGHCDADGYLFVDGRKRDVIISGGENIYPAEIENVLSRVPGIAEVAVIGRPDARWGEVAVAIVVPATGATLTREYVLAPLRERIARFKHPRDVVFVAQLPRTALGKVRREVLREMVREGVVPGGSARAGATRG